MSIVAAQRGDGAGKRQGPWYRKSESLIGDLGLYSKNVGTSLEDFKQGRGLITCERSLLAHCTEERAMCVEGKGLQWPYLSSR